MNYNENLDFMEKEQTPCFTNLQALKQQLPFTLESQAKLKTLVEQQQLFARDKPEIEDKIRHCLICIYNQQDMSKYLNEMVTISSIMTRHYQASNQFLANTNWSNQVQAQPKILKQMVSDTIKEIMNNICDQIILKMCQLGVIVKEPLVRRASFDDYNLCFENLNKKGQ